MKNQCSYFWRQKQTKSSRGHVKTNGPTLEWRTGTSLQLDGLEVQFAIDSHRIPTDNHTFCSTDR